MSVAQDLLNETSPAASVIRLHHFTDASTVKRILSVCASHRISAELRMGGERYVGPVVELQENELRLEVSPAQQTGARAATLRITAWGVRFEVRGFYEGEGRFRVVSLACVRRRRVLRAALPPDAATFVWAVADSVRPMRGQAAILDLTPGGVRVFLPTGQELPSGSFAGAVAAGEHVVATLARVTHTRRTSDGVLYGVALDDAARAPLIDLYMAHRFSQCRPRRTASPEAIEQLMRDSGYLSLRDGNPLTKAWYDLECSPRISGDLVYLDANQEPIGHFSVTRYFSRTWLIQQLAVAPGHPEKDLVKLTAYQFFASYPWIVDGDGGHFLGYYDRSKRWHQMFFERFVNWVGDPALACITPFDRFERPTRDVPEAPAPNPDVRVSKATGADLVFATGLIRAHLPPLHADAMDITPDRLTTPHLHEAYQGSGFERARQALVLRHKGELVGVALCEFGSTSLSLFNLFNIATLYFVSDPSRVSDDAKRQLAHAVRAFYAARGEHNPLVIAPAGSFRADIEPGTALAETMGCLLFSKDALLQYEHFVDFEFGSHLDAKRVATTQGT